MAHSDAVCDACVAWGLEEGLWSPLSLAWIEVMIPRGDLNLYEMNEQRCQCRPD